MLHVGINSFFRAHCTPYHLQQSAIRSVEKSGWSVLPTSCEMNHHDSWLLFRRRAPTRVRLLCPQINSPAANDSPVARSSEEDADDFFSLLEKCQSRRMDEQRYELRAVGPSSRAVPKERPVLAEKQQSLPSKYKEQEKSCLREKSSETAKKRNSVHPKATSAVCAFPGLNASPAVLTQLSRTPSSDEKGSMPDDAFFEMLMRCQVGFTPKVSCNSTLVQLRCSLFRLCFGLLAN